MDVALSQAEVRMKWRLILVLAMVTPGCALNKYVFHNKADWNLSAQVEDVITEQGRGRGLGRIPKDFEVRDRAAAKATPRHYTYQSRLWFTRLDGDRICFSYHNETHPDFGPDSDLPGLKSWIYAVEAHRTLADFAGDVPWPRPAKSAFDSFEVTRNEVVFKMHDGHKQNRRLIEIEMCGPKPPISPEASYLAVFCLNDPQEWDSETNMERYVLLWNITDEELDGETMQSLNLASFRGPAGEPLPSRTSTSPAVAAPE